MASLEQLLCDLRRTSPKGSAAPSAVIEKVREWKGMGESMLNSLATSLLDIDSREEKLTLASEALKAQWRDLKEKERQLELLDEGERMVLKFMEEILKSKEEELDKQFKSNEEKLKSKEEDLDKQFKSKEEKLKSKEEDLDKQLKSVSEEIESLEVKNDEVFRLKIKEHEKLKEIEKREKESDMMRRWADERLGEIKKREKEFDAYCDEKSRELTLKEEVLFREKRKFEEKIRLMSEEIKEKQKAESAAIIEMSKSAQNSVYRMKGFLGDKFKEIESREMMAHKTLSARLNEAELLQESLEKRFKELEDKEKKLNVSHDDHEKSLDLTGALLNDKMTLQMAINGPEKNPELMGSLISEIISRSSDPAKVVLDTVEVFYANCSGKLDMECKQRGRTIMMLDQLAILSPNIQPFVTEAAIKLACEWKSRMGSPTKNPMEALVFLNLVAAYKLSSHFDQEELFRLLMAAAKHKQTPVLCHTLGLLPRIPGYIQKLIDEKKFLLASTFVHEYQFQDRFPQADILSNYTAHARFSANKCRSQHNNLRGQKMAVGNEIAALRLAIKHISQYGLESDYSSNALAARIQQLEGTRASLRRKTPSQSGQMQKQGKGWQKRYREVQVVLDEVGESSSIPLNDAINPQTAVPPRQGSSGASSSPACAWTPKHKATSQRETGGSSNHRVPVPMHRYMGPYKRRRTDLWMNGGGLPVAQCQY